MRKGASKALAVLVAAAALGCVSNADPRPEQGTASGFPGWSDSGKSDGSTMVPTSAFHMRLLDGHDSVFERRRTVCVEAVEGQAEAPDTSGVEGISQLLFVKSRAALEKELKLGAGAKVAVAGGLAGADARLDFANKFQAADTSLYFLIKGSARYTVLNRQPLRLTPHAGQLLESDIARFYDECGNQFADAVGYEASFFVLIRIDTSSLAQTESIAASVGAEGLPVSGGAVSIGPSINASLLEVASQEGVTTQLEFYYHGFEAAPASLSALSGELTPQTFSVIDEINAALTHSIKADRCMDSGVGRCSSGDAVGYFANKSRAAVVSNILARDYRQLPGRPGAERLAQLAAQISEASKFIGTLSAQQQRLNEAIYEQEVLLFLNASDKYRFSIHLPGKLVKTTPQAIEGIAEFWAETAKPGGTVSEPIELRLASCWEHASLVGNLDRCLGKGEQTPEYLAAEDAITKYVTQNRIRPLQYFPVPHARAADDAHTLCTQDDSVDPWGIHHGPGTGYRLPDFREANALGHAVMEDPAVAKDGELANAIWLKESGICADSSGDYGILIASDDAEHGLNCLTSNPDKTDLAVLCVPDEGPFGHVPTL